MAKVDLYDVPHISSLQDMLIKSAQKYSDKLALEDLNDTPIPKVTYNQLLSNVLKFGTALRNLGVKERGKVAIIGENRVQWGIAYLTCVSFNYVVVPIDRKLSENEIMNIIHESEAEVVVYSSEFHPLFLEKSKILKRIKFYICMDYIKPEKNYYSMVDLLFSLERCSVDDLPKIKPDELSVILFTSGTLGKSKGVMLSQKNLTSNLIAIVSAFFIYSEDGFLCVLLIRAFITGDAKQDPLVARGLREFGFTFIRGYGLTEKSPILTLNRLNNFKDNSAGLPLPSFENKIANPDLEGNGEIWAKGPNIMLGYYKNENATNEVMKMAGLKQVMLGILMTMIFYI